MEVMEASKVKRIAELNDQLRQTFQGGQVLLTSGINALDEQAMAQVFRAIHTFKDFNEDNNPHGENDFGSVDVEGVKYFFKIDYYDLDMRYLSDDPSDPQKTKRVMTIMLASEY